MSKKQKRSDPLTLAEWAEDMSRHHLELARDETRRKQNVRSLRFRAKRLAQIATYIRQQSGKDGKHG